MNDGGLRRAVLVGAIYLPVALAVLAVAGWVRTQLALPALFLSLLRGGMALGFPFALLLAWHYPRLGHHGAPGAESRSASTKDTVPGPGR